MIKSIKLYIYGVLTLIIAIAGSVFVSTRKENKVLKEVNKHQEEALQVSESIDKVTTIVHKASVREEASIDNSIAEVKEKVRNNEEANDNDELDPEFMRLLNSRSKVRSKETSR